MLVSSPAAGIRAWRSFVPAATCGMPAWTARCWSGRLVSQRAAARCRTDARRCRRWAGGQRRSRARAKWRRTRCGPSVPAEPTDGPELDAVAASRRFSGMSAGARRPANEAGNARASETREIGPDGFRCDVNGNLWVSSNARNRGVQRRDGLDARGPADRAHPAARGLRQHLLRGPERNRLFMAASQSLYAVCRHPGPRARLGRPRSAALRGGRPARAPSAVGGARADDARPALRRRPA